MFGLVARLLGGAVSPILDQISGAASRLARKAALLLASAVCMVVVVIALTGAFFFWIASITNPAIGALAVAGLYLVFAIVMAVVALRGGKAVSSSDTSDEAREKSAGEAKVNADVDRFAAPLMALLAQFGLKRELLAVMAGSSIAKQLGPVPLVGLAIVGGFLVGRLWKGWRALPDIVASLASSGLFGLGLGDEGDATDETKPLDEAA